MAESAPVENSRIVCCDRKAWRIQENLDPATGIPRWSGAEREDFLNWPPSVSTRVWSLPYRAGRRPDLCRVNRDIRSVPAHSAAKSGNPPGSTEIGRIDPRSARRHIARIPELATCTRPNLAVGEVAGPASGASAASKARGQGEADTVPGLIQEMHSARE